MSVDQARNCRHVVWGAWPAHQSDGIVNWLSTNMVKPAYHWAMTCADPKDTYLNHHFATAAQLEHRFAFERAEDLALFLLVWPADQIWQIEWEEYYDLVDRLLGNVRVE